jgi:hypothetical protein
MISAVSAFTRGRVTSYYCIVAAHQSEYGGPVLMTYSTVAEFVEQFHAAFIKEDGDALLFSTQGLQQTASGAKCLQAAAGRLASILRSCCMIS